jgi:cell division protein FtsI (penicillin-binding protein 3)
LQYFVENELRNTIYHFDADQAFGVVMDPKTGEILAMATSPTFDANRAAKMPPELRRNRVITDLFEPGSTMKTFVIANGLKDKMLAPNTRYQTENGLLRIGKKIIREADEHHRWPSLTVTEILAYSSNIGSSKIASG